jgi:hypothetical protein
VGHRKRAVAAKATVMKNMLSICKRYQFTISVSDGKVFIDLRDKAMFFQAVKLATTALKPSDWPEQAVLRWRQK